MEVGVGIPPGREVQRRSQIPTVKKILPLVKEFMLVRGLAGVDGTVRWMSY